MAQFKLTPPQSRLFMSPHKATAFVGGFGSGKSEAIFTRLLASKVQFPRNDLGYFAPSYSLIRDIAYPRLEMMLDQTNLRWQLNKSDNAITIKNYGKIIFRSLEIPDKIVGFEILQAFVDELDTLGEAHARAAWQKILARTRQANRNKKGHLPEGFRGPINKLYVATTPEGFRFCYKQWKKDPPNGYHLVVAPTASNPYLPEDYVETLRSSYPAELIDAYLNGEFVNLTGNAVYSSFSRVHNHTDRILLPGEDLHVGVDFNVNNMSSVGHVLEVDENPSAVVEFTKLKDTNDLIEQLTQFKERGHRVIVYPDASGKSRKTVDASRSDIQLLYQADFEVMAPHMNPPVKDRIISMNAMFHDGKDNRRYKVNTDTCPEYTEALEQQVYLPNGLPEKNPANNVDDLNDSAGYFIHQLFPVDRPKFTATQIRLY